MDLILLNLQLVMNFGGVYCFGEMLHFPHSPNMSITCNPKWLAQDMGCILHVRKPQNCDGFSLNLPVLEFWVVCP